MRGRSERKPSTALDATESQLGDRCDYVTVSDVAAQVMLALRASADGETISLPSDRLWQLAECARYLQMSEDWVRSSDIPVVMLGRARRYDPDEVKAYAKAHLSHRVITPRAADRRTG